MTKTEYSDANLYFRERFGSKVYKAAISLDVTCPNRDGTKGLGGCIFCSLGGSGEFSTKGDDVIEQINSAIEKLSAKVSPETKYIAYFQSFTNTYCEVSFLEEKIRKAFLHPMICAVSIATRPDCLPDDMILMFSRMNRIKPVMVELGLQTIHEKTAEWFNRCYHTEEYDDAVRRLKSQGIEVITHLIFGLKDETREMMLQSVKHVVDMGSDGIKFTCLYVLTGTGLEKEWRRGEIKVLSRDEYFDIVDEALKILPPEMIVHRLTGDGPKSILLEPSWTKDKRSVVNYINGRFEKRSVIVR
ncbi:MAG: TIGR01212 family radical SAM protein [Clostridiales bacterium]|nr:TIGR01212 family radical SAM protein [Clostridiales bacterium]